MDHSFSHSVAYVSRSGGMSNELNNIICRSTNGVYEGIAIGGDRYVFSVLPLGGAAVMVACVLTLTWMQVVYITCNASPFFDLCKVCMYIERMCLYRENILFMKN